MADLDALKQALAFSPENVPLTLLLAKTYLDKFMLEDAAAHFERALELEPGNPEAALGVIEMLHLNGKSSEAIVRLEHMCRDQPEHAPAWLTRAKLVLEEDNSGPEARKFYDQAIAIDPALANPDILKRIEEAGGAARENSTPGDDRHIRPVAANDWQAGAFYDPDAACEDGAPDADADDFAGYSLDDPALSDLGLEFMEQADANFTQVGGMDDVKEDIRMKILYPLENPDLFKAYGKKPGGGVLLYGPPGCGKTLISRATAGEIKAHYFSVGLHQILDMWIGKSEEKLHEIFELARRHAPSVLFFDEVDALAADRKDMRTSGSRTLVNQFLAELDGNLSQNDGVLVLGATNAPWHLDSAFLRPGRFDRLIFVPPPDEGARSEIIKIMAEGKPVSGLDPASLAKKTKDFSGADIMAMFDQAVEAALGEAMKKGGIVPVSAKDLARTAKKVKPSTRKWFESAKNYALYANQSGFYDDVLEYLGLSK